MLPRCLALTAALLLAAPIASGQEIECVDGLAALPDVGAFPCDGVGLVGYLPVAAIATAESPAPSANNDIWGWTDPETGTEYALVGTTNGVGFVDLSSPTRPVLVGKLPTSTTPSPWRDVKVYADHAYVVSEAQGHGVQVFDLTRLRGVEDPPVTFEADTVYARIGAAHNIVVNEETGFAYAVGARSQAGDLPAACSVPGFHAINIQDPATPTFAGCFSDAALETDPYVAVGYTHDAQCVVYDGPDADYAGREICLAANENVVTVFDVTNKDDILIVSQAEYPNDAYTHQGWLTEDHRFFLVDDEVDEQQGLVPFQRTLVFDLADLDAPEFSFAYLSGLTTVDHNLYVRGRYAFESNYESGLRILDVSAVADGVLEEVGYFDTFPESTQLSYNGQWSNYPYFESGLVVANDINYGLFVLRPDVLGPTACDACGPPRAGYTLSEPAPNPAASGAALVLQVETPQTVRADVLDTRGRLVRSLFDGPAVAHTDIVLRVSDDLPAGVYIVRVVGEQFEASRRLVLTR